MPEMPKNVKDALEAYGARCAARGGLRLIDMATDPGTRAERAALEAAIVAYAEEARREATAWALEWSAYTVDMIVTCHNAATRDVGARAAQAIRSGLPARPSPSPVEGDGKLPANSGEGDGARCSCRMPVTLTPPLRFALPDPNCSLHSRKVVPTSSAPSEPESGGTR